MSTEVKRRILLVDDERSLLPLLRTMCQRIGPDWEVVTTDSGAQALQLMAEQPFDVVVSDMRMPQMNGAQLLHEVMERYPRTARIILSGHADQELILKSLGATHQYLNKPCDVAVLGSTIQRVLALNRFLATDHLKGVVGRIHHLPSLPSLYFKLMRELSSTDATTDSVAALINQDVNLTAKLLQLVNSAFFGVAQQVVSAQEAVQLLGFSTVKTLALSIYVFSRFDPEKMPDFPVEQLWKHSLATGLLARRIASAEGGDLGLVETAFTAGVLHDIGKLVLGFSLPELYRTAGDQAATRTLPQWKVETEVIGASHAEVGAYLLGLWGLPAPIVEAVAWHHQPRLREPREFSALAAVHIADYIHARHTPSAPGLLPASLDREYVDSLKLDAGVTHWEEPENRM